MRFSEEFKEEVRERNPIHDVIGEYVKLERRGERYVGLCPFHSEKTPSFHVIPRLGIYHCFGCKASGDVFKFLQERNHMTFYEAVVELAKRAKLPLPAAERTPEEEAAHRERRALYDALDLAARFFHDQLLHTPEGQEKGLKYFQQRGITIDTIRAFQLGWAPGKGKLKAQLSQRFNPDVLVKANLIMPRREGGGYMDTFFERVMFPITDLRGRVLGFGGRILEGEGAKYKNTADTPVFNKRHVLFGFAQAKEAIRAQNQAILVEGYMDVIIPHQHGIKNVVAPLGTALTQEQCRLLRQQTENVVVAFDADTAGQMATLRSLDMLYNEGLNVFVMRIPDGKDPDEFVRKHGADEFRKLIAEAVPLLEFKLRLALGKHGGHTPEAKEKAVAAVAQILANERSEVKREAYIQRVADALAEGGNSAPYQAAIRQTIERMFGRQKFPVPSRPNAKLNAVGDPVHLLERKLLQQLLHHPKLWPVFGQVLPGYTFREPHHQRIAKAMAKVLSEAHPPELAPALLEMLADDASRAVLMDLLTEPLITKKPEMELNDCLRALQRCLIQEEIDSLHQVIAAIEDPEAQRELMQQIVALKRKAMSIR